MHRIIPSSGIHFYSLVKFSVISAGVGTAAAAEVRENLSVFIGNCSSHTMRSQRFFELWINYMFMVYVDQ